MRTVALESSSKVMRGFVFTRLSAGMSFEHSKHVFKKLPMKYGNHQSTFVDF